MTRVVWANLNPAADARGSWDQGIVEELTSGSDYEHQINFTFELSDGGAFLADKHLDDGAVVVIPGQHQVTKDAPFASALANIISDLPWALTIVTSDEEALFPVDLLPRDDRHAVWNQYHDRGMDRVIPIGAAPPFMESMRDGLHDPSDNGRKLVVSFAGQDTHVRRHELIAVMKDMAARGGYGNIAWMATTGFRQGLSASEYAFSLRNTRIAPCPSGPHSLDSFRLYEALAAGCLPIVETRTPHGDEGEFWDALFGPHRPIPRVASWAEALPLLVEEYADPVVWRETRDEIQRWWEGEREDLLIDFERTIERLRQS